MTPAQSGPTTVVVVDGSNIATEGRSTPSLSQLNDAVMAFTEEFPDATVTVVVDATFGHRIDKKELAEFDAAVAHNEVVAPPAGAIGRGDAFVLSIANKVGARILSNDSFQEFHGDYPWLFDEGRLIGGKPVPYVGWVFVERLPVKGAVSRKATRSPRGGREPRPSRRSASLEASLPMPVPTAPPPGPSSRRGGRQNDRSPAVAEAPAAPARAATAPVGGGPVNDLLPFLEFVEHHPVGSSVNGVVDSYSSHGAYVMIGDLRGYVPLRLMGDPPPRSARELMKVGDAVTLVVTSLAPSRRSVDLSIPKVAPVNDVVPTPSLEDLAEAVSAPAARSSRRRAAKQVVETEDVTSDNQQPVDAPAPEPRAPRRRAAKRPAEPIAVEPITTDTAPEPAPVPAKRGATKRAAAQQAPADDAAPATKKVATKKTTAPAKKAPAKTAAPAKKTAAKKVPATKAPSTRTSKKKAAAAPAGGD